MGGRGKAALRREGKVRKVWSERGEKACERKKEGGGDQTFRNPGFTANTVNTPATGHSGQKTTSKGGRGGKGSRPMCAILPWYIKKEIGRGGKNCRHEGGHPRERERDGKELTPIEVKKKELPKTTCMNW